MGPLTSETAPPRPDPRHSWAVVGVVVAGVLAVVLHLLGVDGVEVVATLLFAVVFAVTLLWGRLAGFGAAAVATLAYAWMRRHAVDEAGTSLYAVVVAGRAASYLVLAHVSYLVADKLPSLPLPGIPARAAVAGQAGTVTAEDPFGVGPAPAAPLWRDEAPLAAVMEAPPAAAPLTGVPTESWPVQPDLEFRSGQWAGTGAEPPAGQWPEPEPVPWGAGDPDAPAFSQPWTDLEPDPEAERGSWSEQWSQQWSEAASEPAAWPGQWPESEAERGSWSEQWSQQWSESASEPAAWPGQWPESEAERGSWSEQWSEQWSAPEPERDASSGLWPEADQQARSGQWPEWEAERGSWSEQWSEQWSDQPPPSWEGNEAPLEQVLPPSWEGGFDDEEVGWDPPQGVPFGGAVEGLALTDDIPPPPPSHAPPAPAGAGEEPMAFGNAPWSGEWPADERGPAGPEPSWASAAAQPQHGPSHPPGIDPGTGLQTAQYLRERLAAEWDTCRSRGSTFSVVMVQMPDTPFQALPELRRATLLRELGHQFTEAGMVDHLVHLPDGGRHWFAVVLGDTDKSGAHAFERRLRMAIAGYLRNRGLRLEDVSSASLTSPDDDETMVGLWSSLLGEPVRGR
jgi:hypothetical protein